MNILCFWGARLHLPPGTEPVERLRAPKSKGHFSRRRTSLISGLLALVLAWLPWRLQAQTRWVSLSPNLTELIFALGFGSNLVGRSSACDYPPAAQMVPVVGDFGRPNWELLLRMKPDCVFFTDLERPAMLRLVRRAGTRIERLPCESWHEIMAAAATIAAVAGEPERGVLWGRAMAARREALMRRVADYYKDRPRPRVYVEIWHHPLTTAGSSSFLHDLVTLAGGVNIGGEFTDRYPHVGSEWVIRQNPDVIVLAYMLAAGENAKSLERRIGWDGIQAIRNGAICCEIRSDLLLRPGPRCLEGAEQLADWLMGRQPAF